MAALMAPFYDEIRTLKEAGPFPDVVEDRPTFEGNAVKKAEEIARAAGCDVLADDSGLCVDALDGAPGVLSARYAAAEGGGNASDEENNALLLRRLCGLPRPWTARFVSVVALARPGRATLTASGEVEGEILPQGRVAPGAHFFGYDPYFYFAPYGRTFGEITLAEKNAVSHRAQALARLAERLS